MSEPVPSRPRFRLQPLVLVVVILGLGAGLFVQRAQFERRLRLSEAEAEKQRAMAEALRAIAFATEEFARQQRMIAKSVPRFGQQSFRLCRGALTQGIEAAPDDEQRRQRAPNQY